MDVCAVITESELSLEFCLSFWKEGDCYKDFPNLVLSNLYFLLLGNFMVSWVNVEASHFSRI